MCFNTKFLHSPFWANLSAARVPRGIFDNQVQKYKEIKMLEAKIQTLSTAIAAIESCRKAGKVDPDGIKAVAAAISLNIRPPVVLQGRQPLVCRDVRAVPGSWPHFAQGLVNAMEQGLELKKLEAQAKGGDEAAKKRHGFLNYLLNAVHGALVSALRFVQEQKDEAEAAARRRQANAKAEEERRAREAAEAARRARKSERKAATDAILAAAHGATTAPETVRTGGRDRHPRLTLDRVKSLLEKESRKRGEEQGVEPSEAKLLACRFVYSIVLRTALEGKHTASEIEVMKAEVKAAVASVKMPTCKNAAEAQREADAWAARAESYARRQNAAPQPAPAAAKGSAPAPQKPAPQPRERRQDRPAPDGHIKGANVMEIALAKAGLLAEASEG
jgi:hypothetical protein